MAWRSGEQELEVTPLGASVERTFNGSLLDDDGPKP
jgi:hypothetical protein